MTFFGFKVTDWSAFFTPSIGDQGNLIKNKNQVWGHFYNKLLPLIFVGVDFDVLRVLHAKRIQLRVNQTTQVQFVCKVIPVQINKTKLARV